MRNERDSDQKKNKRDQDKPAEKKSDLVKMKKKDLLEIMLAQSKEIDRLRDRVSELEAELENREFEFLKIGSIAEASLAVTNIFKEADEALKFSHCIVLKIRRSEGPARDRSEGNLLSRILKTAQETTNKNNQFFPDLNGLRRVREEQRQDQANKSAGWMPWH